MRSLLRDQFDAAGGQPGEGGDAEIGHLNRHQSGYRQLASLGADVDVKVQAATLISIPEPPQVDTPSFTDFTSRPVMVTDEPAAARYGRVHHFVHALQVVLAGARVRSSAAGLGGTRLLRAALSIFRNPPMTLVSTFHLCTLELP